MPGAPRNPQVESIYDDSVKLTWRAPEDDGGSFVTNYIIEKLDPDSGKWMKAATSRFAHCMVENLMPNKQYEFRIIAENIFGPGGPSEPTKTIQTLGRTLLHSTGLASSVTIQMLTLVVNDERAKATMTRDDARIYHGWTTTIDAVRRRARDIIRLDSAS